MFAWTVHSAINRSHTVDRFPGRHWLPRLQPWLLAPLLLALTLFCSSSQAAPTLALKANFDSVPLNAYLDILESDQQLNAQQVASPGIINQFAPLKSHQLHLGFKPTSIWLRFQVYAKEERDKPLYLTLAPAILDHIQIYQAMPWGELELLSEGGSDMPLAQRPVADPYPTFELRPQANQPVTYYLKLTTRVGLNVNLHLYSATAYSQTINWQQLLIGSLFGALLLLVALQLALGFALNEKVLAFYAAYISAAVLFQASWNGYLHFLFPHSSGWQTHLIGISLFLACALCLEFSRKFMAIRKFSKRWNYAFQGYICLCLLGVASAPWLSYDVITWSASLAVAIAVLGLICYATIATVAGNVRARNYMIARLLSMVTILLIILNAHGFFNFYEFFTWGFIATLAVEALLITVMLVYFRLVKQRKHFRAKQQKAIQNAERKAKSETLSRFSHELRNPMNGIMGMTELLQSTSLSENQRQHLDGIVNASDQLLNIINKVVDISLLETGELEPELGRCDITSLVSDCAAIYQTEAEQKQIELICDVHHEVPMTVSTDSNRLQQIIVHLITHALQLSAQGEMILSVAPADNDYLDFELKQQTNVGHDRLKRLLDPILNGKSEEPVGLAAAARFVNLLGGNLSVEAVPQGCRVHFRLPAPPVEPGIADQVDAVQLLQSKRILVVDDNETCRHVMQQQANQWGMNVNTAHSGAQALAILRAKANLGEHFDVILLDHDMPTMTGLQLASKIKEDPQLLQDTLVLMLTGVTSAPTSTLARNAGIRRVLTKPVNSLTLMTALVEEFTIVQQLSGTGTDLDEPLDDYRILVVDDNPVNAKVMRGLLGKVGVDCTLANNGADAYKIYQENPFDLIFMDCEMPGMDGYDTTKSIRQWERDHKKPSTPIVALTAHVGNKHRQQSLAAGMDDHLTKPVELAQLKSVLLQWCQGSTQFFGNSAAK